MVDLIKSVPPNFFIFFSLSENNFLSYFPLIKRETITILFHFKANNQVFQNCRHGFVQQKPVASNQTFTKMHTIYLHRALEKL